MRISPLREVPEMAALVARRAWAAWWQGTEMTTDAYRAGIAATAGTDGMPRTLVAHDAGRYFGSVLLIASDLPSRPALTPWIAALWVEPQARRQGLAVRLMTAARAEAGRLGYPICHLCAEPRIAPYYLARGFTLRESDIEGLEVMTIPAIAPSIPSALP
ncbi:GNAT family N-acetyltransferase [Acidimangrovimonas sediminis]|uniref:GNAT family N-acetyltransferase n=1 Tax=Acidimangrovimonas sediminis TaxID=2056283 RepID=UPI000C7FB7B6|nr:GNAT family N-acetyltransferase [Acidimangrovimonas sediminis]